MEKIKNILSGKGFWASVFLLILLIAIPVTINLIKQQQILKSRAAVEPIKFTGTNVKVITDAKGVSRQIATLEDIEVEVTAPTSEAVFNPNGSVDCSRNARAVFSWNAVAGASSYVIKYKRDADGEETALDPISAGGSQTAVISINPQLSNGPYASWSLTVNYSDNRPAQTKTYGEGFTCSGGGTTYSQSSYTTYSQSSYTTGPTSGTGSGSCSTGTASLSWSGFTPPSGGSIINYTVRVNKAPFGDWAPNETCSSSSPTSGDCTMQAGTATSVSLKLSAGSYGFSIQPGYRLSDGTTQAGTGVNMTEFSCAGSTTSDSPNPTNLSGSCSGNTASLSWTGATKGGQNASNYTVRVNKAPFGEWAPNETCSTSTPTSADCVTQAGANNSISLKLSSGQYGFSIQAGFPDNSVSSAINGPEFSCGRGVGDRGLELIKRFLPKEAKAATAGCGDGPSCSGPGKGYCSCSVTCADGSTQWGGFCYPEQSAAANCDARAKCPTAPAYSQSSYTTYSQSSYTTAPTSICGQTCNSVTSSDARVRTAADCQALNPSYVAVVSNNGGVCTISCGDCKANRTGRTRGSGCDCVNECSTGQHYDYDQNRCVADAVAQTPTPSASGNAGGASGQTVPAGTTFTHFKISETDNETAWSLSQLHPINTKKVSYKFIPQVCVTQPCDTYPRSLRRVYVQFIGKNASNQDYTHVFSKDIMLAIKPMAQSVSCEVPPSGQGSIVTVKGVHFGDEIGAISIGDQTATIAPTGAWNNLQASGTTNTSISSQTDVTLTTIDGQKTAPLKCIPGQTALEFKAQLACGATHKTISVGDLEIREKVGIGLTAPQTPAVSVFKKERNSFSDGKPSGLSAKLIEGKEYELVIKSPSSLQRVVTFKAGKGTTNIGDVDLPMGDIESERGDCVINNFDRSQLLREWTRASKTTTRGDFDQNGQVNSIDHACLNVNFNKRCEGP